MHHRIFWREETTSTSLWEGVHGAIEAEKRLNAAPPKLKYDGHKHDQEKVRSTEEQHDEENIKDTSTRSFSDPATLLREVSKFSDLRRLARVLAQRDPDFGRPEPFMAALHDGNPAVVEMMLRHQREHGGGLAFARSFRSWILNVAGHDDGEGSPRCLPLHASCHAGSPEVLSVLLKFIFDSYSVEDQAAMVNARDRNHRSALHLASWSPRPQCPGRRNAMIRCGSFRGYGTVSIQSSKKKVYYTYPYVRDLP